MALPSITDGFRTITKWTTAAASTPFTICIDYVWDGLTGTGDPAELGDLVNVGWGNIFAAAAGVDTVEDFFIASTALQGCTVYPLDGVTAPTIVPPTTAVQGADPDSGVIPPECSIVVTKRTATRGRRFRGRFYMGGFSVRAVSKVQLGFVVPELANALAGNVKAELGQIAGTGGNFNSVVVSTAVSPNIATPITNFTVDSAWDTQRRRGR